MNLISIFGKKFTGFSFNRNGCAALVAAVALCGTAEGQTYTPGQAYFGRNQYTEYIAGDMPLLFSAPHGGSLTPAEIPDRVDDGSDPNFTTVTDSNTEEVALAVQKVFCNYFGHCPHVTVCQLQRTKIDCNRSLAQGVYNTNVYATQAWNEFQGFINTSSNSAVAQTGFGFYIDLHGQGHAIQRLELGYLLTASQLALTDTTLNQPTYASQSSIRTLAGKVSSKLGMTFSQILRGTNSFGGLMLGMGYPCVPDQPMPDPGSGNPYFDGGYNTAVHGSQASMGPLDSLQIEANLTGVRDTAVNRTNYAMAIARTLDYFFTNYYGLDLRICAPSIWAGGSGNWATAASWNVTLPVSGNYLMFSGAGGLVNNNLTAVSTGTGRVYSLIFSTNASGTYTLYGNAISLNAGITNFSTKNQIVSNNITLLTNETFSSGNGGLTFAGSITNAGHSLTIKADSLVSINGILSGSGNLLKTGSNTLVLSNANTLSGAVSNLSGILQVSGGGSTGSGNCYVNSGSTLAGSGNIGGGLFVNGDAVPAVQTGPLVCSAGVGFSGGNFKWLLSNNTTNGNGTNFGQIAMTGGNLSISPDSKLTLLFTNSATAPGTNSLFWSQPHAWKVISLSGSAANPLSNYFQTIVNGTNSTGRFISASDSQGNVVLNYLPTPQPLVSAAFQSSGSSNVLVQWPSTPGISYVVQFSTSLSTASWTNIATINATSGLSSYIETNWQSPQRFYRIVIP